jgi:hypothetical protein
VAAGLVVYGVFFEYHNALKVLTIETSDDEGRIKTGLGRRQVGIASSHRKGIR